MSHVPAGSSAALGDYRFSSESTRTIGATASGSGAREVRLRQGTLAHIYGYSRGVHFLAGVPVHEQSSLLGSELFWVIVAAVAAIAAVIVAIAVHMLSRTRRALAYEVATTPLLSERAPGALEISYEGVAVRNATLVEVDVRNVGNVPIRTADFESRLVAVFAPGVQLLHPEVAATQPVDLGPTLVSTPNRIGVEPLLLNPNDGFTLQVLAGDYTGDVELQGRIAGITEFQRSYVTPQERLVRSTEIAAAAATGLGLSVPVVGSLAEVLVSAWAGRRKP
jgi:hypothetical protein